MVFQVNWQERDNSIGIDGRVAVLGDGDNCLEIWPALGFNAYRWRVAGAEQLYRNPQFFVESRPTRSGIPILFPFPNRIRDGRFDWQGKSYQLPIGDPAKKNAIHGFVVNKPWRIIDEGADAECAWITGEFHGAVDAPQTLALWPADYRLRITYRLYKNTLRIEAQADNPDTKQLPFGLGYHPYLMLAPFGGEKALFTASAAKIWELTDNLPTGRILNVDERRDLRQPKPVSSLQLDDVMTGICPIDVDEEEHLNLVGAVRHEAGERMLLIWTSPDFRDLVLFTPPHREAVCLEPYTCTTDAINLSQRGIDAGLRILQPGESWRGVIELSVMSR